MNRRLMLSLVISLLTSVIAVIGATPASAAVDISRFRNFADSGKCLDGYLAKGPYVTACNTGEFQQWTWNRDPNVLTPMRHVQSAHCLAASETHPGRLLFETCSDGFDPYQRWDIRIPAGGWAFLYNVGARACVSYRGGETVQTIPCNDNGDGTQRWRPE